MRFIGFKEFIDMDKPKKDHEYSFERLHVWSDIRAMIRFVYTLTAGFPDSEKFGLTNQMRRAAISVGSNLAEGSSRTHAKDQAHFYQMGFSSLMELLSQSIVAFDLNLADEIQHQELRNQIDKISYKINSLRNQTLKRIV